MNKVHSFSNKKLFLIYIKKTNKKLKIFKITFEFFLNFKTLNFLSKELRFLPKLL